MRCSFGRSQQTDRVTAFKLQQRGVTRVVSQLTAVVGPKAHLGALLGGLAFDLLGSPDCPGRIDAGQASHAPLSIMKPALRDQQPVLGRPVHQPMLPVDPPGPPPRHPAPQRFRLTNSGKRRPRTFLDQDVHPFQQRPVRRLPVQILRPGPFAENQPHSSSSCSVPLPSSNSAIEANKRSAFAGLLSR